MFTTFRCDAHIIHMRYSYSDRIAQVVERDASNIKVVSSIVTAVKVFFTFPVERHLYVINLDTKLSRADNSGIQNSLHSEQC